jgi:TubC N-terminal docking domain
MAGAPLLDRLRQHGLSVCRDGDRLQIGPRERLTDDLRAMIREHKAMLIAELTPNLATNLPA